MSACGTSRTSRDVRLESAEWGKADIDQIAVASRDFMSTHPKSPWTAPGGWPSPRDFWSKNIFKVPAKYMSAGVAWAIVRWGVARGWGRHPPAVQWTQVDFEAATLAVTRAKHGTPSTHPLTGRELRALRRLHREAERPIALPVRVRARLADDRE